jgi:hypothetical protein
LNQQTTSNWVSFRSATTRIENIRAGGKSRNSANHLTVHDGLPFARWDTSCRATIAARLPEESGNLSRHAAANDSARRCNHSRTARHSRAAGRQRAAAEGRQRSVSQRRAGQGANRRSRAGCTQQPNGSGGTSNRRGSSERETARSHRANADKQCLARIFGNEPYGIADEIDNTTNEITNKVEHFVSPYPLNRMTDTWGDVSALDITRIPCQLYKYQ